MTDLLNGLCCFFMFDGFANGEQIFFGDIGSFAIDAQRMPADSLMFGLTGMADISGRGKFPLSQQHVVGSIKN